MDTNKKQLSISRETNSEFKVYIANTILIRMTNKIYKYLTCYLIHIKINKLCIHCEGIITHQL